MTSSAVSPSEIQDFLAQTPPFDRLSETALTALVAKCQLLGYRTGQPLFEREKMPTQVAIIYDGQARLLGFDQRSQRHVSLRLVQPKEILGWAGLLRCVPCETAIASTNVIAIVIQAEDFLSLLEKQPQFGEAFREHCSLSEVFELLSLELQRQADSSSNLKDITVQAWQDAKVINLPNGNKKTQELAKELEGDRIWLVSSGVLGDFPTGSRLHLNGEAKSLKVEGRLGTRLVGFREPPPPTPEADPLNDPTEIEPGDLENQSLFDKVTIAPPRPPEPSSGQTKDAAKYPVFRGRGQIDGPLACFQMLSKYFGMKFRRDIIRKVLDNQLKTAGSISIQACGAIAQSIGLTPQMAQVPAEAINRIKAPVLIKWKDSFAIIYSITEQELTIASPEEGLMRKRVAQFREVWGESGEVLLLQAPQVEQKEQFSFWWFVPALMEHKTVFIEVLLASFFVQLFGLANPLISQVIIDKVLGQRSIDTLDILGAFLLGVALFEGLLNALRTFLFIDTSNRIDVKLSAEVIDHLLRLPQNYFDNRRVGDLVYKFSMMGQIREFMTGTALTVVLDAVFSVVYVAVMLSYSVQLTAVSLAVVPVLALMIVLINPLVLRLIKQRNMRFADSQSYLVEVVSGIQTVKAQNIELKSRWEWSSRYAKYITASFKTIITGTTAGTVSSFLNQVGNLAQLWVGAYLVLKNDITLGQLIAFRIISGNVTGSLLRFVSVWQSFQEVSMSIDMLKDVVDTPTETSDEDRSNIPMPAIQGQVAYEEVSFRFLESGSLQLANVNLEFPPGSFVGIVGGSGSGKSTAMKLLQRLYPPLSGRIFIDGYDIAKVELYSLRSQLGVVLQDTLLFNCTVQENIALSNPDASTDEIVRAAKLAVAHDFIMGLPAGYNTVVGERGSSLSGGQRQRLAIARTILQNPRLLILDEATSALDYHSERQVCNNLAEAFKGRTVFFITHRLTTIQNADVIIMMDQGAVVEQGTHKELMSLKGRYYCLFQQQESSNT
ncbi:MAG: ATP-binding cassette domain-containing protein [Oscillatoriales cyanobacterium]|uniref:Peptidase domain-containing ABC transporter n=1 Tax=Microcoleus anatoxicus PTRS2 TaxID=2705321 RepID=A0ABU8YMK9_9CYAN|nr:MAG: ATP-binding cassette domain-containing protein [Oscillatoriales cyanobacterium]TAD95129.1 MAG: ATP-binding cassette domain-containing protein [Oscillatoriales cyanobacterium]TAE03147.1 MAG: ATP-binding cassette domain-containing protein [Oscillatoriales cyanobacterium]TAE99402.1 MAG: ATP-binding cassette domain-containing protein [Oscillatoriales cyanobacterium]TAF69986.1 MAG: ATP-binding cassette domain-containing protein [Oscillatoriales cyanobacterium]